MSNRTIEACARAAYEANRAYCFALGDYSHGPWEHAPEWQTESTKAGVPGVLAGRTPEQMHEHWLADKRAAGWKHGPLKDPVKKEHPCILPYADLPQAQRVKDEIYIAVVKAVAAALGDG